LFIPRGGKRASNVEGLSHRISDCDSDWHSLLCVHRLGDWEVHEQARLMKYALLAILATASAIVWHEARKARQKKSIGWMRDGERIVPVYPEESW